MTPQDTLNSMSMARDALPILALLAGAWTVLVAVAYWWDTRGRPEDRL